MELSRRHALAGAAALAASPLLTNAPARAAAPVADKQAPSFYRYKVGDAQVTAISDGVNNFALPDTFVLNAKKDEVNAALDYLEVMGKAPVASDAAIEGMKADAEYRVANGIPVIPRFPCWTKQELLDAENAIIEQYSNVNKALFSDYFAITKVEGNLHMEEEGSTQDMYAELTKVLQAVVTDQNADVPALMKTANDNYQTILDNGVNK
jgi:hypothetical protein